jgi:peroxiredoxin
MWPHERSLVKNLADKPFAVIGVNISEPNTAALKKLADKENLTWRSFSDPPTSEGKGVIAKKWNLAGTPTIYLVDHKGVIRNKWVGGAPAKIIDNAVEKLIHESEAGKK